MIETAQDLLDRRRRDGEVLRARLLREDTRGRSGPAAELCAIAEDEFCWGTIWARPLVSPKTRAALALAMTAGLRQMDGVREMTRIALDAGWSADEIAEIMLHVQCYGGLYAARAAAETADEVIAEHEQRRIAGTPSRPATGRQGVSGEHDSRYADNPLALLGLRVRREVLGRKDVDASMTNTAKNEFMMTFFDATHEYCFGKIWARGGLEYRLRSILSLSVAAACGQAGAVRRHTRSAVEAGLSKAEIAEIMLHVYVYAGVYPSLHGFTTAQEVFAELVREGIPIPDAPASGAAAL